MLPQMPTRMEMSEVAVRSRRATRKLIPHDRKRSSKSFVPTTQLGSLDGRARRRTRSCRVRSPARLRRAERGLLDPDSDRAYSGASRRDLHGPRLRLRAGTTRPARAHGGGRLLPGAQHICRRERECLVFRLRLGRRAVSGSRAGQAQGRRPLARRGILVVPGVRVALAETSTDTKEAPIGASFDSRYQARSSFLPPIYGSTNVIVQVSED